MLCILTDIVTDIGTNHAEIQTHGQSQIDMEILQITDYCPEWAFPEVSIIIQGILFKQKQNNNTFFIADDMLVANTT